MKKPHWFRWIDFASMAGLGFVAAGVTVYTILSGGASLEGLALLWTVTLLFFGIWANFAYQRKKWLDGFLWIPKWGFMVRLNTYQIDTEIFDDLVEHTVAGWSSVFDRGKIEKALKREVKWVWFIQDLAEEPQRAAGNRKVEGYTIVRGYEMAIDYDAPDQPLLETSFAHELGHLIQGHVTGLWDQTEHHERSKKYGLK